MIRENNMIIIKSLEKCRGRWTRSNGMEKSIIDYIMIGEEDENGVENSIIDEKKPFTNTVKHATHKTNRHINRATHNIQGYNITLTTSQVQEAIKQSKNNNSQGPDKLNIRHLKDIGPLGLAFLTSMFKTALNKNIIPHA